MRVVGLVLCVLLALARVGRAQPAPPSGPIRIAVECEGYGRTKACPAFLLGFVDANKVLLQSPRSGADVVLYASATEVALADHIHLRFVGTIVGAPKVIEVDTELDSRGTDDQQRAQLEPTFLRGIALFVAARHPEVVTVALAAPDASAPVVKPSTTPYGVTLQLSGSGNWTTRYQSYSGFSSLGVSRLEHKHRANLSVDASGELSRQPPLTLDDGTKVSLDSKQWSVGVSGGGAWLYDDCWSFGGSSRAWRDDPKGQFRFGVKALAGVEWDKYRADDPRGNRLAVLYVAGWQVEGYNVRNEIGERFAQYPVHALIASGTLRKDKVGVGISLQMSSQVNHPLRRHELSASPFVELQLGGHVDVSVSFSVTKRQLPGPDPDAIDPTDFEQQSRLSYADPLSMNGSLNLSIHWDRTNGARNDRFSDI